MKKLISLINQYSWGKQLVNLKVGQKNTPNWNTKRKKSFKINDRNIQEFGDNIRWSNICVIRISEGEGRENRARDIIKDNGKELMKDTKPQIQESPLGQRERKREEQQTLQNTL